ncbi:DUF4244 domain-containing protein [Prauserella cavernicola]|nr:DUF4244 domain-containing protein [Prauserella cavernicola]
MRTILVRNPLSQRTWTLWPRELLDSDDGMSTAEYAIGTIAAAAFAALLYTIVTGDSVLSALTSLIERAISVDF